MYTDEDLNAAVQAGVFSAESVERFKKTISEQKSTASVDEENFRLVSGFNDIFVVIACVLLLVSSLWFFNSVTGSESMGLLSGAVLSWLLAEFFVLKRKMALPAIVLLLSFVGSSFAFVASFSNDNSPSTYIFAAALSAIATYLHWLRFKVPITIAAGMAVVVVLCVSILIGAYSDITPQLIPWLSPLLFVCGLGVFALAMYWDAADTTRTTRQSDVAFWLHLLAAPLIIHPVFSWLGVLDHNDGLVGMVVIICFYAVVTLISLAIDRRAFMVSSLVYVLYAISSIIEAYGDLSYSFALTGCMMGGVLLLLSAFWHRMRSSLVPKLPNYIQHYVPKSDLI
ncbi:MAG: hypothetical protein ACPGMR_03080 [Pontibacterium sp.]